MSGQDRDRFARGRVPYPHTAIVTACGSQAALRADGDARVVSIIARHSDFATLPAVRQVPPMNGVIAGQEEELVIFGAEDHGGDNLLVTWHQAGLTPAGVPEPHRSVPGGGSKPGTVRAEGNVVDKAGMAAEHAP